jgi:hypothetical protein
MWMAEGRLHHQNLEGISAFPIWATCSAHLIFLKLITEILFDEGYKLWSCSLCSFLQPPTCHQCKSQIIQIRASLKTVGDRIMYVSIFVIGSTVQLKTSVLTYTIFEYHNYITNFPCTPSALPFRRYSRFCEWESASVRDVLKQSCGRIELFNEVTKWNGSKASGNGRSCLLGSVDSARNAPVPFMMKLWFELQRVWGTWDLHC